MNTGGGKTLVGLLIAQALVNESRGRVLYVCPTIQLVEQVQAKAAEISLDVAAYAQRTWANRDLFDACETPCVTTYAAVLNGKSIFRHQDIRGVIFDDAHVATSLVQEQFTLHIAKSNLVFERIVTLFRPYFVRNNQAQRLDEARSGEQRALLFVPTFEVAENVTKVRQILVDNGVASESSSNRFAWDHLKDRLHLCVMVLNGSGLEITPALPPIETLGIFGESTRRVYLTASLPSRIQLVRTFGVSDPCLLVPGGKSGEAQRQFILAPGATDEDQRSFARDLTDRHKAAIISPSHASAAWWCPPAEKFDGIGEAELQRFRQDKGNRKIVMPARYDGVDLPGNSCRVLILDGLPTATSRFQRFLDESLRIERLRSQATATRLTQAMGRIFRSNTDHGAIVITGGELKRWLRDPNNQELLPPLVQRQVQLGIALAKAVEEGQTTYPSLLAGVLSGDREWDRTYSLFIGTAEASTTAAEPDWFLELTIREREAFRLLWSGGSPDAANVYAACAVISDEHGELRLSAWLRHWEGLARLLAGDKEGAGRLFFEAASHRAELGRPDYAKARLSHVPVERPSEQARAVAALFGRGIDRVRKSLDEVVEALTYDASAPQAEEALKNLGTLLGLTATRPDNDLRTGPDVLWLVSSPVSGALLEAKTKKDTSTQYQKDEIGQMHDHLEWARTKHPGGSFAEVIVGRPLRVSKDVNPSPRLQVMGLEEFRGLCGRVRELYDLIAVTSTADAHESTAEGALRDLGLKWPQCLDSLSSVLAVDLKPDLDPDSN